MKTYTKTTQAPQLMSQELTQKQACKEFCGSAGLNFKVCWKRAEKKQVDCKQFLFRHDAEIENLENRLNIIGQFINAVNQQ